MISLLQLKTQTLIFTMQSEVRWLLALQRCDWCSFCIHSSAVLLLWGWEKNMYIPVGGATGVPYVRRSADGILLATASD